MMKSILFSIGLAFVAQISLAQWTELGGPNSLDGAWPEGNTSDLPITDMSFDNNAQRLYVNGQRTTEPGPIAFDGNEFTYYNVPSAEWLPLTTLTDPAENFRGNDTQNAPGLHVAAGPFWGFIGIGSRSTDLGQELTLFTDDQWYPIQSGTSPVGMPLGSQIASNPGGTKIYGLGIFLPDQGTLFNKVMTTEALSDVWTELGGDNSLTAAAGNDFQGILMCTDPSGNVYVVSGSGANGYPIAKYNGTAWSVIPADFNSSPKTIYVDGDGNIYLGGTFTNSQGNVYVAKYDGSSWTEVGANNSFNTLNTNNAINVIKVSDSGTIYAAGSFVNSNNTNYVAQFDGSSWSELGGNNSLGANGQINCIEIVGNDIYVAGAFTNQSGKHYVAKYGCSVTTPVITPSGNTTICEGSSITLTSSSTTNNTWSNGASDSFISVGSAGSYTVSVSSNGCSATSEPIVISVEASPVVSISPIGSNGFVSSDAAPINLSATPAGGAFSGNGVNGSNFNPSNAELGTNQIEYTATSNNGCEGSGSAYVIVYDTTGANCTVIDTITNIVDITVYDTVYTEVVTEVFDTTEISVTEYDTVEVPINVEIYDTLLLIDVVLSIGGNTLVNSLLVYPNPANDHITIDYGVFTNMMGYSINIENSLGEIVFSNANINSQSDYIDLNTWSGVGLYFIHIINPQGSTIATKKIVLQ